MRSDWIYAQCFKIIVDVERVIDLPRPEKVQPISDFLRWTFKSAVFRNSIRIILIYHYDSMGSFITIPGIGFRAKSSI
jgi:hypothetical protein